MFGFGVWEFLIIISILVLLVLPFWTIFSKAGYSSWWSLLILIPWFNLFVIYYFAFSKWPIYKSISKIDNVDKESKTGSGNTSKVNFSEEDKPTW